ncbi:hypothetical protein [Streptomyces sp. NPDC059761]|uniref:hypothetical protein n=1 Tax=Streptomyces sp. NPDC059761 TaxID=3346937 RepID=UPI0036597806
MGDEGKILDIKTADLKATAPVFHDQSEALGTALGTLAASLAKAGAAWGDDEPGKEFYAKYGRSSPRSRSPQASSRRAWLASTQR